MGGPVREIRNNFLNRLGGQTPPVLQVKGREATERTTSRLDLLWAVLGMLGLRMQGEGEQILMVVNGPVEPLREFRFPALAEHGKGGLELGLTPLLHIC